MSPGYKQTEAGVIPEDWEVKPLGYFCETAAGRDLVKENFSPTSDDRYRYPIYSNALTNKGLYGYSKNYQYEADKITVTARGDVGHAMYRSTPFCAIGRLLVLSSKRPCDLRFVTEYINNYVEFALESTGVPQLTAPQISTYAVALPPTKDEQAAIAEALSDADALIESLEQLITKKRQIKQGAMQELLAGKKRLPGFSDTWEVKRLGDDCELITKGTTPTSFGKEFTEAGINFIKVESLDSSGKIIQDMVAFIDDATNSLLKRSQLKKNDLLVSIAGALGRAGIVDKSILPANTNQALAIVRLKKESSIHLQYAFYVLGFETTQRHIDAISAQGAQANLSLQQVGDFPIYAPSLVEQIAIATILSDMDTELAALETKLTKTRQLKQGMMQELLTGRIRLL